MIVPPRCRMRKAGTQTLCGGELHPSELNDDRYVCSRCRAIYRADEIPMIRRANDYDDLRKAEMEQARRVREEERKAASKKKRVFS